jgi:DNA mismatch repair protein MutS2
MQFMLKTLEFDTILNMVAAYAKTEYTKQQIIGLTPDVSLEKIAVMLDETDDMLSLIQRLGIIPLIEDFDISELLKLLSVRKYLSIKELMIIRLFLSMEKDVFNYFSELKRLNIGLGSIRVYFDEMTSHHPLLVLLRDKIDDQGLLFDDATPVLHNIRKQLQKKDKLLQERLQKCLSDYGSYLNDMMIVIRNDRFCIPVKEAFKHKVKGVIHDVSASKQTIYIEPEVTRQITADIETLKAEEKNEIEAIIRMLSLEVLKDVSTISINLRQLLKLDFITAKALYAKQTSAQRPNINDQQIVELKEARHPLLDPKEVVPIGLTLDHISRTILITGPNTGGKTVALKTLGLLTLMMQSGLLIPAKKESNLSVFKAVYADIGDEQSISQSLSTFSSHMKKIIDMLDHLDDHVLVLLDELGSGTDPNEGVCLAIAILDAFMEKDIRMMVTTHYSELKMYAYEKKGITTASVAFDKNTLKPLYYLQMKTTGSSHAFLIAQKLGLNQHVLSSAKTLYEGRQTDLAKVMEKLNEEMQAIEEEKKRLYDEIEASKEVQQHYQMLKEKLIKEKDAIILKTKTTEEKKWQELKSEAESLIKELSQKQHLSQPEYAKYKHQINKHIVSEMSKDDSMDLKIGDEVYIKSYQQNGTIKAFKDDMVRVKFGMFDLWFEKSELTFAQKTDKIKTSKELRKQEKKTENQPGGQAKLELDLRGFRYEEVYEAIDQAIDQAILSGLSSLRIIHGFGTGAVRKAVHAYIKSSPHIKSHRFGGEGEGLNGVTVITLK